MKIHILCPTRERAVSAHPPSSLCYRNRFPYDYIVGGGPVLVGARRVLSLDRIQVHTYNLHEEEKPEIMICDLHVGNGTKRNKEGCLTAREKWRYARYKVNAAGVSMPSRREERNRMSVSWRREGKRGNIRREEEEWCGEWAHFWWHIWLSVKGIDFSPAHHSHLNYYSPL